MPRKETPKSFLSPSVLSLSPFPGALPSGLVSGEGCSVASRAVLGETGFHCELFWIPGENKDLITGSPDSKKTSLKCRMVSKGQEHTKDGYGGWSASWAPVGGVPPCRWGAADTVLFAHSSRVTASLRARRC